MSRRRASSLVGLAVVGAAGLAACHDDGDDCFLGDRNAAPEIALVYRTAAGELGDIGEGDTIPVLLAPQGGYVLFAGIRATNYDRCTANIRGFITDECSGRVLALEGRPLARQGFDDRGDGWAEPLFPVDISAFVNLPACPSGAAERDVDGPSYLLTLRLEQGDTPVAESSAHVVLTCADAPDPIACACQCDADFVLGEACPEDPVPDPLDCPA